MIRVLYTVKRALYNMKRALYNMTRALYTIKRAQHSHTKYHCTPYVCIHFYIHTHMHVCVYPYIIYMYIHTHFHTLKAEKSPIFYAILRFIVNRHMAAIAQVPRQWHYTHTWKCIHTHFTLLRRERALYSMNMYYKQAYSLYSTSPHTVWKPPHIL